MAELARHRDVLGVLKQDAVNDAASAVWLKQVRCVFVSL